MKSWDFGINQCQPVSIVSWSFRQTVSLGLLLAGSIIVSNGPGLQALAQEVPWAADNQVTPVAITLPSPSLKDGVYVYGRAKQPEQVKTEYMVFRVNQRQVTGAVYMPRSSYDCFQGSINANHLNVKVLDSYNEQVFDHQVNLNAYYPLENVSENDGRILQTCLNDPTVTALQ